MTTISGFLGQDHQVIDATLLAAREAATSGDWPVAQQHGAGFTQALRRHIEAEEKILFPAFEAATGMTSGPTEVMRFEHEQMRYQLQELQAALAAQDAAAARETFSLLVSLLELHNAKEERMLYPMCDSALAGNLAEILPAIEGTLREPAAG